MCGVDGGRVGCQCGDAALLGSFAFQHLFACLFILICLLDSLTCLFIFCKHIGQAFELRIF